MCYAQNSNGLLLCLPTITPTTGYTGNYIMVNSGTACNRITSLEECDRAAKMLGLEDSRDGAVVHPNMAKYPPYCYMYRPERHIWFNTAFDSPDVCDSTFTCICRES